MPTEDFIIELFCQVDDAMLDATKHSQATLFPSEVVTLALLFALKGRGNRAFYRWLKTTGCISFPVCRIARACFVCSIPIVTGWSSSWLIPA